MVRQKDSLLWSAIRRKLFKTPQPPSQNPDSSTLFHVIHTNNGSFCHEDSDSSICALEDADYTAGSEFAFREDLAAIAIQAWFRGHLARRAYRALRSLVKLQAVARGVVVRRQARIALHCMHALARLQVTVRARHLLLFNK